MRLWTIACAIVLASTFGCGKDDKSAADRDAEVKKVLQRGAEAEQKMYEGMKQGVENIEKKAQEKTK